MSGKENFPFIKKDEPTSIFFLYGKRTGISGQYEISQAYDLAERTESGSIYSEPFAKERCQT
jgi:hypothetical protein